MYTLKLNTLTAPLRNTYFLLDITKYHLPWKCCSRVKLPHFCQVKWGLLFCGEHKLQNRHSMLLITSSTQPAWSKFFLLSGCSYLNFQKKNKKKRLLQLECSVVFGHFQKTITFFWGGSISSMLFIAACAHSKRHWGPVLFKRFICEIV